MPMEAPESSPDLLVAAIGFAGVLVGAAIAVIGQWLIIKRNEESESAYVAANLVAALDQLAHDCGSVAFDDGTSDGQPAEDGYHYIQIPTPVFSLPESQTNLKHLSAATTYKVLVLPNRIKSIERLISHEWENDSPPDFPSTFQLRQYSFANLGIDAANLAEEIRKEHKILSRPSDIWNPLPSLIEKVEAIDAIRAKYTSSLGI